MPEAPAPQWYPGADRSQSRSYGTMMPTIEKLVLHTTESTDWPGYPTFAPTLTYHPWRHAWRQHMPIRGSASTLANAGSFQTNRDNVAQIEIVAFADESMGARYDKFVGDLDQQAIDDLGRFIEWLHREYGVPIRSTVGWKAYNDGRHPSSYGADNGVRLGVSGYSSYVGTLGHMHVPGNLHGDPGSLRVDRILNSALGHRPPEPEPEPTPPTPDPEETMIDRFVKWRNRPQKIHKAKTWQKLRVDNEGGQNVVSGSAHVLSGVVHVVVDGLKEHQGIYIRPYVVDSDDQSSKTKRRTTGDYVKLYGPPRGKWIRTAFPFTWNLGAPGNGWDGRRLRFEVSSDNDKTVIHEVEITGAFIDRSN